MDGIRVGIIGTGGISRGHAKRFRERAEARLAALADPEEASLKRFRAAVYPGEEPPPAYDDYRKMLDKEGLNAVLISSPHTLHFKQIMDCLDRGLHVLAEKPLACSTNEAEQIVAKAKAAGKHVVVSYQRRFAGLYRYMKEFIREPAFGKIFYVSSFLSQGWLKATGGSWRQDPALSGGGQLHDSGSHIVDMISWMLPDAVTQVTALSDNRGTKVDIDSAVAFRTQSGTVGTVSIIGSGPTQLFHEDMTVSGENGRALFLRNGGLKAVLGHGREIAVLEKFGGGTSPTDHFLDLLRNKCGNESPPEDYLKVIRFTEAAWRSAAKGGAPIDPAAI